MPRLIITLDLPEGTKVSLGGDAGIAVAAGTNRDPVEEYWTDYLSPSGRKLYEAAARIERIDGAGFTLEDIADNLSIDYESAKSYHRNSGRTATRWEREKGIPAPIQLVFDGTYMAQKGGSGLRSQYALPAGAAEKIRDLLSSAA
jgi:hypothetical protein